MICIPGMAELIRGAEPSLGLNRSYSPLNYLSLAIVLLRGACGMSTTCGIIKRWKVLQHLHTSRSSTFKMVSETLIQKRSISIHVRLRWKPLTFLFLSRLPRG